MEGPKNLKPLWDEIGFYEEGILITPSVYGLRIDFISVDAKNRNGGVILSSGSSSTSTSKNIMTFSNAVTGELIKDSETMFTKNDPIHNNMFQL